MGIALFRGTGTGRRVGGVVGAFVVAVGVLLLAQMGPALAQGDERDFTYSPTSGSVGYDITADAIDPFTVVGEATPSSKPAVYRLENAVWFLRDSLSSGPGTTSFRYGRADGFDVNQMLCDWDADGTETPGLRRRRRDGGNPMWLLRNSNTGGPADVSFVYGREDDTPICGDWNGDGHQTPGVVRRRADNAFEWHLRNELAGGPADVTFFYGRGSDGVLPDFPVAGDWDGNGSDTPGLVRGRDDGRFEWLLRNELAGGNADLRYAYFGGAEWGDDMRIYTPRVGDWNGDGVDTAAVIQSIDGSRPHWLLRDEHAGGSADHEFVYGRGHGDIPLLWK